MAIIPDINLPGSLAFKIFSWTNGQTRTTSDVSGFLY